MIIRNIKYCFLIVVFLTSIKAYTQFSQEDKERIPTTRILFVFDGSQSMYARWQSDIKINIAQKLLSKILDSLRNVEHLELAFRVYGHQHRYPPQVCNDTKLEVPFGKNNINQIKHRLNAITPKGTTPIAYALEQAGKDFSPCDNCRNIIVLITDGIEECGGDPCEVSKKLQKDGLVLKPFIVGIGRNFSDALDCVGTYFDASSEEQFQTALNIVISQALNSTTSQVNLLDENGKPNESNVNMTFYDDFSGKIKYNFIHTLNYKGLPDTLYIDPLLTYDLEIHTIPPVRIEDVTLTQGKHTTIPVDVPQGYLKLTIDGPMGGMKDISCLIKKNDSQELINVQNLGRTEKYLTGKYDLEILCMPRITIDDVEVRQSHTTTVAIPLPGIAVINKTTYGFGSLYKVVNNKLEWIYNLREDNPHQESLILQPGDYRVVFRSKSSTRAIYTIERQFVVESGKTTNVKLYSN